jgi:hypothetical protein
MALCGYSILALLVHAGFVAAIIPGDVGPLGGGFDAPYYYWRWLSALDSISSFTWLDTRSFFPFTLTSPWGEPFLLPALIGYPLVYLGLPPLNVFGLLLIVSTVATGYCTYRLCYQLTGSSFAAFIAGAAFSTAAFFGHGSAETPLFFGAIIPLIASAALSILARPGVGRSIRLGLLVAAGFYTSIDITLIALTLAATLLFSLILIHPGRLGGADYLKIGGGLLLGVVPTVPFVVSAMAAAPHLESIPSTEVLTSAAALTDILTPPRLSSRSCGGGDAAVAPIVGSGALILLAALAAFKRLAEARVLRGVALVFLGALLLAGVVPEPLTVSTALRHGLALSGWLGFLAGLILLYRLGAIERRLGVAFVSNRAIIASFAIAAAVAYVISLGPVDARDTWKGISMYAALDAALGSFRPYETPAYSAVGTLFAIICMATFTFVRIVRRIGTHLWIAPLLGLLIVVENNRSCSSGSFPTAHGAIFSRLNDVEPGVVAVIPLGETHPPTTLLDRRTARRRAATILNALQPSGLATVNGASLNPPGYFTTLARATRDFPSAGAIKALAAIPGVRYVIVRTELTQRGASGLMDRAAEHAEAVRYLDADGAGNYLFEFIATSRVRGDFELLIPVHPRGILTLELQALYEKTEPHVPVKVVLGKDRPAILTEVNLKANGQWQSLSIPIPALRTGGAPVALRLEVPDGAKVLVRHPRLVRVGLDTRSSTLSH